MIIFAITDRNAEAPVWGNVGREPVEGVAELPTKKLSKSLNFHKLRLFYIHKI